MVTDFKINKSVMKKVEVKKMPEKRSVSKELIGGVTFFLIIGICLVGYGIYSDSYSEYYFFDTLYFLFFTLPGTIIIISTVISGRYFYLKSPFQLEEKQNYMNLKWLHHHYYDLRRSLQDIADDQGVSMLTVKKWVDKIDVASVDVGVKE